MPRMLIFKHLIIFLQLCCFTVSQGSPFDQAQITIDNSPNWCFRLPDDTVSAQKVIYNETLDSDLISQLSLYLDESGQPVPLFSLQDMQTGTELRFDTRDTANQLVIIYPDQTAIAFYASGITLMSGDCSTAIYISLPGWFDYLLGQTSAGGDTGNGGDGRSGDGSGGTKRSTTKSSDLEKRAKRPPFPAGNYFIKVVIYDQCGLLLDPATTVSLSVVGCTDTLNPQGVNGLFEWSCQWPSVESPEQKCEVEVLRQLGYGRDDFGTAISVPSLISALARGLSDLPTNETVEDLLRNKFSIANWAATTNGLNEIGILLQLIDSQHIDPNDIAYTICFPHSNLREDVWLSTSEAEGFFLVTIDHYPPTIMEFNIEAHQHYDQPCTSGPHPPRLTPTTQPPMYACGEGDTGNPAGKRQEACTPTPTAPPGTEISTISDGLPVSTTASTLETESESASEVDSTAMELTSTSSSSTPSTSQTSTTVTTTSSAPIPTRANTGCTRFAGPCGLSPEHPCGYCSVAQFEDNEDWVCLIWRQETAPSCGNYGICENEGWICAMAFEGWWSWACYEPCIAPYPQNITVV